MVIECLSKAVMQSYCEEVEQKKNLGTGSQKKGDSSIIISFNVANVSLGTDSGSTISSIIRILFSPSAIRKKLAAGLQSGRHP